MSFLDESQRLRENPRLAELLTHYATLGKDDRAIWQDRLMSMEGIDAKELSKLHGELIAFDWIEQNTGQTSALKDGVVAACYRITLHGLREMCRLQGVVFDEKPPEVPETSRPKFMRKKKQKAEAAEMLEPAVPPFVSTLADEPVSVQ